jgi:hypothetical protein
MIIHKVKLEDSNKPNELKSGFIRGEMEERLAYLNMDETKANEHRYFLIILVLLMVLVAFGCEDREKEIIAHSPQTICAFVWPGQVGHHSSYLALIVNVTL